jgi:hypothetical protein
MALRVLIWVLVWASGLRALAATVGLWAAGTLDAGTTLLVAVLAPSWLFVLAPTWFAWRVLGRLAPRPVLMTACWLSPLVGARDLAGLRVFVDIAAEGRFPPRAHLPADAWTALAAALQAERQRSSPRAERIRDALRHLPAGSRFPWLARVHGVEALVLAAIERGDWTAASRHAELGRGRLVRLLALLARSEAGEAAPALVLWGRWALAPMRLRTYPWVRALWRRQAAPAAVTPAPAAPALAARPGDAAGAATADPRLRHVLLLGAAAGGQRIPMRELFSLATAWEAELGEAALARLHARALELDLRDGGAHARALRATVLDELAQLAAHAEGPLPAPPRESRGDAGGPAAEVPSLAGALAARARERLFQSVHDALAPLGQPGDTHPLEAWQAWVTLRALLERAEQQGGRAALATLWHAGVRDAIWNSTCALFDRHGARAAWAAHAMFAWLADRAEVLGDLAAVEINRENARVALRSAS